MKKIINIITPILILLILTLAYYHKINETFAIVISSVFFLIQFYVSNFINVKDES